MPPPKLAVCPSPPLLSAGEPLPLSAGDPLPLSDPCAPQTSRALQSLVAGNSFLLGQAAWHYRPQPFRSYASQPSQKAHNDDQHRPRPRPRPQPQSQPSSSAGTASSASKGADASPSSSSRSSFSTPDNPSMPAGWEDDADLDIRSFSQLPHRWFGTNQHIKVNEDFKESLRQILWQFRAPIRYAFAYGSGVFSQQSTNSTSNPAATFSPHPHPPEAVTKWQEGGGKIIDFIFGVSHTQHWHSINMQQNPHHYSGLKHLGSYSVSRIQDSIGAGVYFNPFINVNGVMIKYGVVNLDTICRDLSEWDTLYLAGRLQKPVKILRDDPRVRLANQINLMSAVRTALLMLPEQFSEKQLYEQIASLSYMGDPRMNSYIGGENPRKVANIVGAQLPNFRQLYVPLVDNLPNVDFNDSGVPKTQGWEKEEAIANAASAGAAHKPDDIIGGRDGFMLRQDMDPKRRGNMVRRLPKLFRQKLYYQYQKKFGIPGSAFDKIVDEARDEDSMSIKRREGGEFEQRISSQDDLTESMGDCVRSTVSWPSTSQSVKGFFTAGLSRSWKYYSEKRQKSKEGQTQKAADAAEEPARDEELERVKKQKHE
ncbi:hypothetical protein MBLNU459_g5606t1 [Dothideomycetes sp. NU459]